MLFDIRTLLVAVTFANVFCAGARLLLWRMHPAIPGLGRWALAGGAGALALFFILLSGIKHWPPALSLAQLVTIVGLVLAWDGFRRFVGSSTLSARIVVIIAVIMLSWIATAQILDSILVWALGNSIFIATFSALIAYELLTVPKPIPPAMRVTGWAYASNAVVFFIRALSLDLNVTQVGPLNPDGFAAFMLLWWLCMTITVTLGMVLMAAERLQSDLDNQANRDPLTGALNRRAFSGIAEKELSRARRYNTALSLLMMDLDKFKQTNDEHGHDAGDQLLCQFVTIAGKVLRKEDIFCRFGGEEFVALLPNTSAQQALVAAEKLRRTFENESGAMSSADNSRTTTVSIGIAELALDDSIESLLSRADVSLYIAKKNGRNCCVIADGIRP